MSHLYPIFLNLEGKRVLVVGAGPVACRKVAGLLDAAAHVVVVAPRVDPWMAERAQEGQIELQRRIYQASDLERVWLAIAATGDCEVNRGVFEGASERRIPCNVVDCPELCSFHVPAALRRGLLQIAVATGGVSPSLARRIRSELELRYGPRYGQLLDGLAELRQRVKREFASDPERRHVLLKGFLDDPGVRDLLERGDEEAFRGALERWISQSSD